MSRFLPQDQGWMRPEELGVLAGLATHLAPEMGAVLEIGCWKGLATSALTLGPAPVICIDPFTGNPNQPRASQDLYDEFVANMTSLGRLWKVVVWVGKSRDLLPMLKTRLRLALVDGSHAYEDALGDIAGAWDLLSAGGVMAIDDIRFGGVENAIDELGFRDILHVVDSPGGARVGDETKPGKLGLVVKGDPAESLPRSVLRALRATVAGPASSARHRQRAER